MKSINLNMNDILNNKFNNIENSLIHFVRTFIDKYEDELTIITEKGYRLDSLTFSAVFQKRDGGCNENKEKHTCEEIDNLNKLIGLGLFDGCRFEYKINNY